MKGLRVADDLALPEDAITQTFVIFGKRGSGKSNTGVVLAEEMHRAGGQIIVLDPVGAWWGLKSSFDGSGPGVPVYIFGGSHGDLPLQPTKGQLMAQVAIGHRVPMILDMSGWSGRERAGFVTAFARWLLAHNDRTPVHIFLEEADAFIPQRPYKGEEEMLGAMDRLIRWGRQEGIGATAITQRSAKINKDVTTQAEVLIAHRTIGPQDVAAIRAWIEYHASGSEKQDVLSTLPTLPDGEAWVWSPDWLDILRRVAFRRRSTYDSASTPKLGEKRIAPKSLAQVDIDQLRDQLSATIEQAKANDPKELQREVVALRRQLAERPAERIVETVRVEVPVVSDEQVAALRDAIAPLVEALGISRATARPLPALAPTPPRPEPRPPQAQRLANPDGVTIGKGERTVLGVLSQWPEGRTYSELAFLAGYSAKASTLGVILSKLRQAGYVATGNQPVSLTPEGLAAAGGATEMPKGEALLDHWLRHPRMGKGERDVLRVLIDRYPADLSHEALCELAGYSPIASTMGVILSKLRKLGLVEKSARRIAPEFAEAIAA